MDDYEEFAHLNDANWYWWVKFERGIQSRSTMGNLIQKAENGRLNNEPMMITIKGNLADSFDEVTLSSGKSNPVLSCGLETADVKKIDGNWTVVYSDGSTEDLDYVERQYSVEWL